MKRTARKCSYSLIFIGLLSCVGANLHADSCSSSCNTDDCNKTATATPYIAIRSQSVDSARELVGWANDYHIHRCVDGRYWSKNLTFEYSRTFKNDRLVDCLFGDSLTTSSDGCSKTIQISGSQVTERGNRDWLADYFGLPTDFESTITVKPLIKNWIWDFNFFIGLEDCCFEGLFFRVHAPLVYTNWRLGVCESVTAEGVNGYNPGYFTPYPSNANSFPIFNTVPRNDLLDNFEEYVSGEKTPNLQNGVYYEPLRYGKWKTGMCSNALKATRLSEIQVALGNDIWQCEDYHVGLELRASIPTGTRPKGEYVFEPVIGNGHHWEFGVGYTSHYTFWRDCDCEQSMGLYFDVNVTHMFKTKQKRTFDLCKNGPASRYMLAERICTPVEGGLQGNPVQATPAGSTPFPLIEPTDGYTAANAQFKNYFTPVANLTHRSVNVSIPIQVDGTLLLNYTSCGVTFDVGYNFWYRSCEHITPRCDCPSPFGTKQWALKGDAEVYGLQLIPSEGTGAIPLRLESIALSSTESNATIFAGTNRPCGDPVLPTPTQTTPVNTGVDNAQFAYNDQLQPGSPPAPAVFLPVVGNGVYQTSIQPVFLTDEDVDYYGARTLGQSNKVFAHLAYNWCEDECGYRPYLGVGGKAEFGQNSKNKNCNAQNSCFVVGSSCDQTKCCACKKCALTDWGVWVKGGVSFN